MIDTLFLANKIEEMLNQNQLGIKFLIFADEGDLRKKIKKGNREEKFTHGILEVVSSNLIPIRNISFSTVNAQLTVLVDLMDMGYEKQGEFQRPQSRNLIDVKNCLDNFIETFNGTSFDIVYQGTTFKTSIGLGQYTTGQKMSFGEMADCLPLYISISFSFFENGINTNDCNILINGEDMYFTRAVITKVKTADQNEFANEEGGRTLALVGGKSIDLILPCVNTKVGTLIMQDILNDKINNAVAVEIKTPLASKRFIGVLGTNSVSMDIGSNLGYNLSIVQGVENLLNYNSDWEVVKSVEATANYTATQNGIVFWGDGESDAIKVGETLTHTYTDDLTVHQIRIFKE